jgi:hypothetical protein
LFIGVMSSSIVFSESVFLREPDSLRFIVVNKPPAGCSNVGSWG